MRKIATFAAAVVLLTPASAEARTLIQSGTLKTTITRVALGRRIPIRCSRDYLSSVNRTWASATFYDGPGCTQFGSDGITILHLVDRYNGSPGLSGSGRWEPVTAGSDFQCPIISYSHQPQVPENVAADLLQLSCSSLPRVPLADGASFVDLKIKPSVIVYTGDGTGALGGSRRGGSRLTREFGRLRWLNWTSSHAQGAGDDWVDNCDPDCAGGTRTPYPIRVSLFRPRVLAGVRVFTRMRFIYTHRKPSVRYPRFLTLPVVYRDGEYSW